MAEERNDETAMTARLRLPRWWLAVVGIDPGVIAVLCVLLEHADRNACCWPSQRRVAERLQRSRSWVNEAIGRACALRLVTKERRRRDNGGETTCFYRIALKAPFPDNVAGKPRHEQPVADQARPAPVKARAARHHVSKPAVQDVPADWRPSPEDLTWAASRYPAADLDRHTERFVHRCRAKGYRFAEIGAAWREWLAEAQTKEPENRERAARNAATQKNRLSVWAAVARGGAPAV